MNFKVDTDHKTITIIGRANVGELLQFIKNYIGTEADQWDIIPEIAINPVYQPIVIPNQPTPEYEPLTPVTPYPMPGGTGDDPWWQHDQIYCYAET